MRIQVVNPVSKTLYKPGLGDDSLDHFVNSTRVPQSWDLLKLIKCLVNLKLKSK